MISFTQLITVIYLALNTVRVFSYVPQIIAVGKDKSPAKAIALTTWIFWTLANFTTALYASFVAPDFLLSLMSYGNTLGCGTVVAIVLYKRKKYAQIDKPAISVSVVNEDVVYATDVEMKNLINLK